MTMELPQQESLPGPAPAPANDGTIKEVDFYKNPTILSRLILNQKYESALRRLKKHPSEASIWVCAKRNPFKGTCMHLLQEACSGSSSRSLGTAASSRSLVSHRSTKSLIRKGAFPLDYSMRQLPIHVACSNLLRASKDQALKSALESFISHLVVVYPEGCSQVDHEGTLPLHEAISHNAKPSTISMLLMASPKTIHERDKYGRTPLDINLFGDGDNKEQIKEMLLRGSLFWVQARSEARDKMNSLQPHENLPPTKDGDLEDGHASETLPPPPKNSDKSNLVEPVTWVKLEKRAIRLELLLADSYEKNYEANALIEELQREKQELQDEIERLESLHQDGKYAKVQLLLEENDSLRLQVQALQQARQSIEQARDSPVVTPPKDVVEFLEDRNSQLQQQVHQLTISNQDCQIRLERLEIVVDSINKMKDDDSDYARLLGTLQADSHYATERFLSKKVLDLEGLLADAEHAADNEIAQTRQENSRLMRENQIMHDKMVSISALSMSGQSQRPLRNLSRPVKASRLSGKSGQELFQTDDLAVMLHRAAEMYGSDSALNTNGSVVETVVETKPNLSQTKEVVFNPSAQPSALQSSPRSDDANSSYLPPGLSISGAPKPLAKHQHPDSLLKRASNIYGQPIPPDFAQAFRQAWLELPSLTSSISFLTEATNDTSVPTERSEVTNPYDVGTSKMEKLLLETARLHQQPIPKLGRGKIRHSVGSVGISKPRSSSSRDVDGVGMNVAPLLPDDESTDGKDSMELFLDTTEASFSNTESQGPNSTFTTVAVVDDPTVPESASKTQEFDIKFGSFIQKVEDTYKKPIPAAMVTSLRKSFLVPHSVRSESSTHDYVKKLDAAESLYGAPFPDDIWRVLVKLSFSKDDVESADALSDDISSELVVTRRDVLGVTAATLPSLPDAEEIVFDPSVAPTNASSEEAEAAYRPVGLPQSRALLTLGDGVESHSPSLDSLLDNTSKMYGKEIPPGFAQAFRKAWVTSPSIPSKGSTTDTFVPTAARPKYMNHINPYDLSTRRLEELLLETARLYQQPIPIDLSSAVHRASLVGEERVKMTFSAGDVGIANSRSSSSSVSDVDGVGMNVAPLLQGDEHSNEGSDDDTVCDVDSKETNMLSRETVPAFKNVDAFVNALMKAPIDSAIGLESRSDASLTTVYTLRSDTYTTMRSEGIYPDATMPEETESSHISGPNVNLLRQQLRVAPTQFYKIAVSSASSVAEVEKKDDFDKLFASFIQEVEDEYKMPLSTDLVTSLRIASFMRRIGDDDSATPDFAEVLKETERLYRAQIPDDIRRILTSVAVDGDDDTRMVRSTSNASVIVPSGDAFSSSTILEPDVSLDRAPSSSVKAVASEYSDLTVTTVSTPVQTDTSTIQGQRHDRGTYSKRLSYSATPLYDIDFSSGTSSAETEDRKQEFQNKFRSFIREVEGTYRMALPIDLVLCLKRASSSMAKPVDEDSQSLDFEMVLEEAERLYRERIPEEIRRILICVASGCGMESPSASEDGRSSFPAAVDKGTIADYNSDVESGNALAGNQFPPDDSKTKAPVMSSVQSTLATPNQTTSVVRERSRTLLQVSSSVGAASSHLLQRGLITEPLNIYTSSADSSSVAEERGRHFDNMFGSFIQNVEKAHKEPLPTELVTCLRQASFSAQSVDDDDATAFFTRVLEEAERLYAEAIPDQIRRLLIRIAGDVGDANVNPLYQDDNDDLDSVLQEAERLNGQKLSSQVVRAWNAVKIPESLPSIFDDPAIQNRVFDPLDDMHSVFSDIARTYSITSRRRPGMESTVSTGVAVAPPTDDLNTMYLHAAKVYSQSMFPAMEQFSQPSFSKSEAATSIRSSRTSIGDDSTETSSRATGSLDGKVSTTSSHPPQTGVMFSAETLSTGNDDLDNIFKQAARSTSMNNVSKNAAASSMNSGTTHSRGSDELNGVFNHGAVLEHNTLSIGADRRGTSLNTETFSIGSDNLDDIFKQAAISMSKSSSIRLDV